MKKRLYIKKGIARNTGKVYVGIVMDFGYRIEFLKSTPQLCAEMLGLSVPELYELDSGEYEVFVDKA